MSECKTSNPTALRSRKLLKDALLLLLQEQSLSDVSVGELCARAQLTRPTFYNHFGSKAALATAVVDDALDEFEERIVAEGVEGTEGILKAFLEFWDSRRELLTVIAKNGLLPLVGQRFRPHLQRIYAASPFTDKTRSARELAFHDAFLTAGMAGMLEEWVNNLDTVRAEDVANYMENMLRTLASGMERDGA